MRFWGLVLSCVAACSTDTFTNDDAATDGGGSDATNDGASTDAPSKGDVIASEGGSTDGGGGCLILNQTSGCGSGGGWCSNETCCATDGGAQCTNSACNGTVFACHEPQDCTASADASAFTCCLMNATITPDVCPRAIKGGNAACMLPTQCASITTERLCAQTADCSNGKTCQRANIGGTNNGITVGICL